MNGIEETIDNGQLTIDNGALVFDIGRYQPKTFAIRTDMIGLVTYGDSRVTEPGCPLALPYNIDLMSYDNARSNAVSTYTYAYPAELIPDTLFADDLDFVMGPRESSAKNVLRLSAAQTVSLPSWVSGNKYKLYLLLASPTVAGSKVRVMAGEEETVLDVPYFSGRAAEPPSCTTLTENYRKENIVFASSHAHNVSDKINQTMQMLYIYKYGIELPDGVNEVTINSSDRKTFLFAATIAACQTDDIVPFAPLTTEIETPQPPLGGEFSMDNRLVPKSVTASHKIKDEEGPRYANDQDPTTKWCVGSSQSQTPWLQFVLQDTATVTRWMVLGAARESGGYVAKAFKLQYQAEDGTWIDADVVEGNQMNKVIRTLEHPITTSRVRLQMIQGEQNGYTTRIYEFAVYGYLQGDDPTDISATLNDDEQMTNDVWYDLSGRKIGNFPSDGFGGSSVFVQQGKKVLNKK